MDIWAMKLVSENLDWALAMLPQEYRVKPASDLINFVLVINDWAVVEKKDGRNYVTPVNYVQDQHVFERNFINAHAVTTSPTRVYKRATKLR